MTKQIHLSGASLYDILQDEQLIKAARASKFTNAEFAKNAKTWRASFTLFHSKPADPQKISWSNIDCTSKTPNIKTSPCITGSSKIVWYRRSRNLKDYIHQLSTGTVTRAEHERLFKAVVSICGRKFINNNFHVNTLHFKSKNPSRE